MVKTTDFSQPQVVIIDLGLAVSMAKKDGGDVCGTPGYIPPETLRSRMWFPKGDLFSIGVVMMQLITRRVPVGKKACGIFQERCRTMEDVFTATRTRKAPMHLVPREFPQLRALLEKLLRKRMQPRITAAQALKDSWFYGCGEGDAGESWALSEACKRLKPRNRFATIGISKGMLDELAQISENQSLPCGWSCEV